MGYRLAVFDMDGTILDTIEDLADSLNYCMKKYGMKQYTVPEVKNFVGNGIRKLVTRAVPEGTPEEVVDAVFQTFVEYYGDHCSLKTRPYPGILEAIRSLRSAGIRTAVVSNKVDGAVHSLCRDYFDGLFDDEVGDKPGQQRKPSPDSVNAVLEHLGISRRDAVYIGDSEVDFATAKNANMDLIMVSWGFRERQKLEDLGAERIADDPAQLPEWILG